MTLGDATSAPAVPDWTERLRASVAEVASDPSYVNSHRAYQSGLDAPDAVAGFVALSCGILRNATVEPWLPELYVALLKRGIKATFRVGDYSVYERYASAPSELGTPEPGCFLVYLDPEALAGDARHDPPEDLEDALVHRVRGIVGGLLEHTRATIIVSNLAPEPYAIHTLHGDQDPCGWAHHRRAVNLALTEEFAAAPRVAILDMDRIVAEYGVSKAYDLRMRLTARSPFKVDFLPHLGRAFADIVAAAVLPPKKCVVVDCDNTLWRGILGEDGPEGVELGTDYPGSVYREFQHFLAGLGRRGFLLALNSKNNEADVMSFLETSPDMILRADDFAAHRINWRDKAANLNELAQELNIGLDSMIFIDDSPFECARVSGALPEVQVERFPAEPMEVPGFQAALRGVERLRVGTDDLARTESIRANVKRERLRRATPDFESFLRSLEIELAIVRQDRAAVSRVSQLSQRTNQFNLTTKRYGIGDVERLMRRGIVYTASMKDRFSDYGIVAVAIVKTGHAAVWDIDSFMLSCRAFGRRIEGQLLQALLDDAAASGARSVKATYLATPKNEMTRDFFPEHGFAVTERAEEVHRFELTLAHRRVPTSHAPYTIHRSGFSA